MMAERERSHVDRAMVGERSRSPRRVAWGLRQAFPWAALLLLLWCGSARADESRYALLIASHEGLTGEAELEHAGSDAKKMAAVLTELGGFLPDNVVTLIDADATRARDALARMNARLRSEREPGRSTTLLVYFSGHADERSLHLGTTVLPWDEVRNAVEGSSADLRMLIVDACRSGQATRVKGLKPDAQPFTLPVSDQLPEGFVILTSAAQGEDAQESDAIGGSFFTHHLISALRGAADGNDDQLVSLDEAYRYARDQTIAATSTTSIGVQHPTFRYALKGRGNVILTRLAPTRSQGRVALPGAGHFIFHVGRRNGPIAAEVSSPGVGTRLSLGAGKYFVRWRERERFREGDVVLVAGKDIKLEAGAMQVFEYGRFVRKGGGHGAQTTLTLMTGIAAAPTQDYLPMVSATVDLSLELQDLTIDLLVGYGYSDVDGVAMPLHELALAAGVRKVFDLSLLSLSVGLRVGLHGYLQETPYEASRMYVAPAFDALMRLDIPIADGPLAFVLEGGMRVMALDVRASWRDVQARTPVLGWGRLGLAASF